MFAQDGAQTTKTVPICILTISPLQKEVVRVRTKEMVRPKEMVKAKGTHPRHLAEPQALMPQENQINPYARCT